MKISIITATLNSEEHLEQTIESILSQNYSYLDYVIVDGGSSDGTLEIIEKYKDYLSCWISEPDKSISDAFNKGIRLSQGQMIGIVSSDDFLPKGVLQKVAETCFLYPSVDVLYGNAIYLDIRNNQKFIVRPDADISKTIWLRQPLKHAATFVSRQAYERFGYFDTNYKLAMDYDLVLRMYLQGAEFKYTDTVLGAFRGGGINQQNFKCTLEESREIAIRYGCSPLLAGINFIRKLLWACMRKYTPTYLTGLYRQKSSTFQNLPN